MGRPTIKGTVWGSHYLESCATVAKALSRYTDNEVGRVGRIGCISSVAGLLRPLGCHAFLILGGSAALGTCAVSQKNKVCCRYKIVQSHKSLGVDEVLKIKRYRLAHIH